MRIFSTDFLRGYGSTFSLFPPRQEIGAKLFAFSRYNANIKSDQEAIADAWNATGNDLQTAIIVFQKERQIPSPSSQLMLW